MSSSSKLPLTKIVATIGPKSEQLPVMTEVVAAGMRIMRINFSHATYEEADLRVKNLRLSPGLSHGKTGSKDCLNLRAVMLDTQGPEIRTGMFEGVKSMDFVTGQKVRCKPLELILTIHSSNNVNFLSFLALQIALTANEIWRFKQSEHKIWVSYKDLLNTVKEGSSILFDDGAIEVFTFAWVCGVFEL